VRVDDEHVGIRKDHEKGDKGTEDGVATTVGDGTESTHCARKSLKRWVQRARGRLTLHFGKVLPDCYGAKGMRLSPPYQVQPGRRRIRWVWTTSPPM
jgi:hypothetical protein